MTAEPTPVATLVALRAAHHGEASRPYDRVVFEFDHRVPVLRVEYVPQLVADGTGLPVSMPGRAILLVQFTSAQAHDASGHPTAPNRLTPRLPLVKAIVSAGDYEGIVTYGIGLGRKAETRLITMIQPDRLVIDVLV